MSNGGVNVAALGFGGIDTSNIVSGLVAIAQQPYNQIGQQQQQIQSAKATISSFANTLSSLQSSATALSDPTSFNSTAAKSSDPSITATASGLAAPGQWTVSVSQVAQEQRNLSSGTSSSSTALGLSGTLNISVGSGTATPITIAATDTLSDITSKIATSGLRVQASMVYDGSQYHLLLAGLDTGRTNGITVDETGLSPGFGGFTLGLSANVLQPAQDAIVDIGNPTPPAVPLQVTSPTNQVTGAIPGVTLAVTQKSASPATITIQNDASALQTKVQAFVNAYNAVVGSGHSIAGYGTQKAANQLLQGDRGVRSSIDQLGSLLAQTVPGTSGAYTTLGSVGISMNNDGTLTLDAATLSTALATDPASVKKLFVTDPTNGSTGIMGTISNLIDQLSTGSSSVLQAEGTAFGNRYDQLGKQMTAMQTRIAAYQTQLQTQFTQMNTMLAQYKQMSSALGNGSSSSSNGTL
ncbi:MAG: flagellar filament capping protein FliD [Myxococcales bacterium]|nr:flagellar filament capping protein FliD [Myxococcales bacterium]